MILLEVMLKHTEGREVIDERYGFDGWTVGKGVGRTVTSKEL